MRKDQAVDNLLLLLGTDPMQYSSLDKWPAVFIKIFFLLLPFVLGLIFISPLFWIWVKKKKWTLRNVGIAVLQGVGLLILALFLLFYLAAYLQGKAFEALNGIS